MADSREIGLRVGAAHNQAAQVVSALVSIGYVADDDNVIVQRVSTLAKAFLGAAEATQAQLTGASVATAPPPAPAPQVQQQVEQAFPGTQTVPQAAPQPAGQPGVAGYNTAFSGSSRPLVLAEHPELDAWLHAQCAAVGVTDVWDNRGKPNYVQAINSGAKKTPPPFRSATEGIDKSFWPPS